MCTTASRSPGLRVWFLVPDMCICVFDPLRGHVTWRAAASARARSAAAGGGTVACAAQGPSAIPSIPWWLGFCRGRRRLRRQRSGSLARGGAGALCPRECESTQPVAPEMIIYTPPRSCQWHPMLRCRQGSSFYVPHLHTALPSLLCPGQCPKRLRDEELVPCAQGLLISNNQAASRESSGTTPTGSRAGRGTRTSASAVKSGSEAVSLLRDFPITVFSCAARHITYHSPF